MASLLVILPAMNIKLQGCLPQKALSRLMGWVASCRCRWFKNAMIRWFIRSYQVNLSEAERTSVNDYTCFNDFFTRYLKPGVRNLAHADTISISPADGVLSQFGTIQKGQCIQAKGVDYSVAALLADTAEAEQFDQGLFYTIYLSPRDYHRVHMPVSGRLTRMMHVPGCLFSVNEATAAALPGLFAKNERVVCYFDTEVGPMAMILVGAMIVASIFTQWHGCVTPPHSSTLTEWDYSDQDIRLARGDEMGYFQMGSTVITLFAEQALAFMSALKPGQPVQLGNALLSQADKS
jgi:phosphatidylserine decarboxylase